MAEIKPGARVQTNERFAELFRPPMAQPWLGMVVRAVTPRVWLVHFDGVDRSQYIHEMHLEVEK